MNPTELPDIGEGWEEALFLKPLSSYDHHFSLFLRKSHFTDVFDRRWFPFR